VNDEHGESLERELVGAVLRNPELLGAAADVVTSEDFTTRANRLTWEAMLALDVDGKPLDAPSLRVELQEHGNLGAVGGGAYLGSLLDGVPRVSEGAVVFWARKVRERGRLRRLAGSLRDVLKQADGGMVTADELHATVERVLADGTAAVGAVLDRGAVASATWALLEAEVQGKAAGIATGLPDLDHRLRSGGWRPGQLVYIGARTSRGKSALLVGFAEAGAAHGKHVLFVPLEMSPEDLGARRLVAHAGVSLAGLHSWRSHERGRVLDELGRAREILARPLDFTSAGVRTLGAIRAACRRQKQRHGLDLVCVDYLGLIQHDRAGKASLYERTTLVSQGLKALAMDLQIPVLCAVQLNREPSTQNAKGAKPSLAHFRDSGAIEQDCDIALLIHQEGTRDAIEDGDAEVIVAKQRNGWTGSVPVCWRAACARFECREATP
jgi:replicative DNA helicase